MKIPGAIPSSCIWESIFDIALKKPCCSSSMVFATLNLSTISSVFLKLFKQRLVSFWKQDQEVICGAETNHSSPELLPNSLFSTSCSARALTSPQASAPFFCASVPVCKMGKNCTSLINKGSVQQMLQYRHLTIKRSNTVCTK